MFGAVSVSVAVVGSGVLVSGTSVAAVSAGDVQVFYSNTCSATIMRLDPDGSQVAVTAGRYVTAIAASPATETLAFDDGAAVYLVDYTGTSRRRIVQSSLGVKPTGWSPDGTTLWLRSPIGPGAWVYSTVTRTLSKVPGSDGYTSPTPDPADPEAYYADTSSGLERIANGSAHRVTDAGPFAVAPTGDLLAVEPSAGVIRLVRPDGTVVADNLVSSTAPQLTNLAFSPDEHYVYGTSFQVSAKSGDNWVARVDVAQQNQTPQQVTQPVNCAAQAFGRPAVVVAETTPPSGATGVEVRLNGAHPVLRWTNPSDRDFSHVVIARYVGSPATGAASFAVSRYRATSYVDSVSVNAVYTYTLTAVDGAGNAAAATQPLTMEALTVPALRTPTRVSDATTALPFRVSWGGTGSPASVAYTIEYLPPGTNIGPAGTLATAPWQTWLAATTSVAATFGRDSVPYPLRVGDAVPLRARAIDRYGNATAWSSVHSTLEPYDDNPAARNADPVDDRFRNTVAYSTGWSSVAGRAAWLGSVRLTRRAGAKAVFLLDHSERLPWRYGIPNKPTGFQLIGDRCSRCGSFRVYVDGRLVGTYSSHSETTRHRTVLVSVHLSSTKRYHKLVITNLPTSSGAQLRIDGFTVL